MVVMLRIIAIIIITTPSLAAFYALPDILYADEEGDTHEISFLNNTYLINFRLNDSCSFSFLENWVNQPKKVNRYAMFRGKKKRTTKGYKN